MSGDDSPLLKFAQHGDAAGGVIFVQHLKLHPIIRAHLPVGLGFDCREREHEGRMRGLAARSNIQIESELTIEAPIASSKFDNRVIWDMLIPAQF